MQFIPAIDLMNAQVVRLAEGDFEQRTTYGDDPLSVARAFADAGAERLHIVDLDGARSGAGKNQAVIQQIVRELPLEVQVGGGIRDRVSAERWLSLGVKRVVIGTMAVAKPDLARALCEENAGNVIISVDGRDGKVATHGWTVSTEKLALELAREAEQWGAFGILYTDVARDGLQVGANVEATGAMQDALGIEVIASGGVGSLGDLKALRERGIRAVVSGRALYEKAFDVADAIRVSQR